MLVTCREKVKVRAMERKDSTMDTRVHRSPATSAAAASASSTRPAISIQLSKVISPSWGTSAVGRQSAPLSIMSPTETVLGNSAAVSSPSWLWTYTLAAGRNSVARTMARTMIPAQRFFNSDPFFLPFFYLFGFRRMRTV